MEEGVGFPALPDGRRSATATGQAVVADAARAGDAALGDRLAADTSWRSGYLSGFCDLTVAGGSSAGSHLKIAAAGLDALRARLVFARDGEERPLAAFEPGAADALATATIRGQGRREEELAVPYRDRVLRGEELREQLEGWAAEGVVERGCADAVAAVLDHPEWLGLPGRRAVLLGAGAEMGPLGPLTRWGAEVVAVDVPDERVWRRILGSARDGAGTVHVPVRGANGAGEPDPERAGADLLADLPELTSWTRERTADAPCVVGTYAYADGAAHVQATAAADAIAEHLLDHSDDVGLAFLATPTDAYVVPPALVEDARRRWGERRVRAVVQAPLRGLTRARLFAASYRRPVAGPDGREWGLADALVPQQGPNYALAKRLQRWRAALAAADGRPVSLNVAPATTTRSVTKNRLLAAAYAGAHRFGVEVFRPETTRALMAALLVHDVHRPPAPAAHPEERLVAAAAHGGMWRAPYEPRSVLGLAALAGLPAAARRGG